MNLKINYFYLIHIYFKLFSNQAIYKLRAANTKPIKTKYRKIPVYFEFAVV